MTTIPPSLFQYAIDHPGSGFDEPTHLAMLLNALGSAGKFISSEVSRAALGDILGLAGGVNSTDDVQHKLDVISDDVVASALAATGLVCAMASEENEGLIVPSDTELRGPYVVAYDPVDGSSNIDVAASIGTVFGIYRRVSTGDGPGDLTDVLQPGTGLIAAGYILYGSSTILAYSSGDGVHFFTLDPTFGEFLLTRDHVVEHGAAHVYSINEGNSSRWNEPDVAWVEHVKAAGYSGRYIGALVADFHRNLQKGGIYAYPGDSRIPAGKLRLLFECAPLAYVAEQSGGAATDGRRRILELQPAKIHHQTPLYIGSQSEVDLLASFHAGQRGLG